MRYELISNSNKGVLIDPTPILRDMRETFKITFALPHEGAYIALFRDEVGVEYKAVVCNDAVIVPKEIIGKEQRVGLTVCLTDGEKILWAWECHPFKVGAFLYLRKTQWQLTAGFSDEELLARLAEIERIHAEAEELCTALQRDCNEQATALAQRMEQIEEGIASVKRSLASIDDAKTIINRQRAQEIAFLAFAWAEYSASFTVNKKNLSLDAFAAAFGYGPLTDEETKKIETISEVL